jgi:hypothetical protein
MSPETDRGRREGRMPDRHPWPACKENARGGHHRYGRTPALPAQWCYGLYVISLVRRACWPPCRDNALTRIALDTSVGVSGPHDFTVRETPLVRTAEAAHGRLPSIAFSPHATDDPDAPLGWTRTKREHKVSRVGWQAPSRDEMAGGAGEGVLRLRNCHRSASNRRADSRPSPGGPRGRPEKVILGRCGLLDIRHIPYMLLHSASSPRSLVPDVETSRSAIQ